MFVLFLNTKKKNAIVRSAISWERPTIPILYILMNILKKSNTTNKAQRQAQIVAILFIVIFYNLTFFVQHIKKYASAAHVSVFITVAAIYIKSNS